MAVVASCRAAPVGAEVVSESGENHSMKHGTRKDVARDTGMRTMPSLPDPERDLDDRGSQVPPHRYGASGFQLPSGVFSNCKLVIL